MGTTPTHHPPAASRSSTTDPSRRAVSRHRRRFAAHAALPRQAEAGDREAFAELYHKLDAPITAYVTRSVRDRDLDAVPGLVQDTR